MTVQEKINIDLKLAMLNKEVDKKDLLRVVIGEFNRVDKIVSDDKAIAIIKKMVENAKDQGNTNEIPILEVYLPSQLDADELGIKINEIIDDLEATSMKDMGRVMGELKAKYSGTYDGKLASTLVRELLG